MRARAWLVLKPHNREWTSAPHADDPRRETEPNLLGSAPSPGRLVAVVADLGVSPVVPNDGLIAMVAHNGRVAMVADDGRRVRRCHHVGQCDRCESHEDVVAHQSFPCQVDHCDPPDNRLD